MGTTYSEEIEEGMTVDTSVEAELQFQFFGRFKTLLNVSHETGYDWNQISTASQNEAETIEVSATAPPGYVLMIEQTVGTCDHSTVQTDMFKISHVTKSGNVDKSYRKRMP